MAFLTLFRVSTGDNWNGIMKVIFSSLLCSVALFLKKFVPQSFGYETGVAIKREEITVFMTDKELPTCEA